MIRFSKRQIFVFILSAVLTILASYPLFAGENDEIVHFGFIPRYNPVLMYKAYQPMMDYLTEVTPFHFELKLSRNYLEAVYFLRDGDVEVASLGGVTFVQAARMFGAVPVVRPLTGEGLPYYRSIIVVRNDSDIKSLEDLRGRTFAFGSPHSTSGHLVPRYYLQQNKIGMEDLKSVVHLEKHDNVAKAVLKGVVDAGALKDVMAYRYRDHGLRFLAVTGPIPTVPIAVNPGTPDRITMALKRGLLRLDPDDPEDRQVMQGWDPEFRYGFIEAAPKDFEPISRMIGSLQGTCMRDCHP